MLCKLTICDRLAEKKGFCDKHYKWYRKDYCTPEGVVLKVPQGKYRAFDKCKVLFCRDKPRCIRLCPKHYDEYHKGKRKRNGKDNDNYVKKTRSYNKDWKCLTCGTMEGPFVLGFCTKDYRAYKKGYIKYDGTPLKKLSRRQHYPVDWKCLTCNTDKGPFKRGLCPKDYISLRKIEKDYETSRSLR